MDGLEFGEIHRRGQDESADSRTLRSREQETAGGVVLAQPSAVRLAVAVDLGERDLVAKEDGYPA